MAGGQNTLEWKIVAQDDASVVLERVDAAQRKLAKTISETSKATEKADRANSGATVSVGKLAAGVALGTAAATAGLKALTTLTSRVKDFAVESVRAAQEKEVAEARLAHILQVSTGATQDQINALKQQADALEAVGVVSEDAIMAAQGQLATFDLQAASIQELIPSFLDMVVAEKGVNATTEDVIGLANGLGKVLQGQVGALSKQGFIFDENTEKILKYGTESERVAALSEVLNSTYEGLNQTMRKTSEGGMKGMQMQIDKLQEGIGKALLPILDALMDTVQTIIKQFTDWAFVNGQFNPTLQGIADKVTGFIIPAFDILMKTAGALAQTLFDVFTNFDKKTAETADEFDRKTSGSIQVLKYFSMAVVSTVGVVSTGVKVFLRTITGMASGVVGFAQQMWNTLVSGLEVGLNMLLSKINRAIKAYNALAGVLGVDNINEIKLDFSKVKFDQAAIDANVNKMFDGISSAIDDGWEEITRLADRVGSIQRAGKPFELKQRDTTVNVPRLGDSTGLPQAVDEGAQKAADELAKAGEKIQKSLTDIDADYDKAVDNVTESLAKLERTHAEKVAAIKEKIDSLRTALKELQAEHAKTMGDMNQQEAERVVEEEKSIQELTKRLQEEQARLNKETDAGKRDYSDLNEIQAELDKRKAVLEKYLQERQGLEAELQEARRRAELTDFERFVEDINARRTAEDEKHAAKIAQMEAEIAKLEEQAENEQIQYELMRDAYIKTLEEFGKFHDGYVTALQDMEKQTDESVTAMRKKLEEIIALVKAIESEKSKVGFADAASRIQSGGSAGAETTNVTNAPVINLGGVTVKSQADADDLVRKIIRELELAQLNTAT